MPRKTRFEKILSDDEDRPPTKKKRPPRLGPYTSRKFDDVVVAYNCLIETKSGQRCWVSVLRERSGAQFGKKSGPWEYVIVQGTGNCKKPVSRIAWLYEVGPDLMWEKSMDKVIDVALRAYFARES